MTSNGSTKSVFDWDWDTKFIRVASRANRTTINKVMDSSLIIELLPTDRVVSANELRRRSQLEDTTLRHELDMLLYADLVAPVDDGGAKEAPAM